MTRWYETLFQQHTMKQNYEYLLETILHQMGTDGSDYMSHDYRHSGECIQYHLDNLDEPYRKKVLDFISYDILKKKILDVEFGFGSYEDSEEDRHLFYKIRGSIIEELYDCSSDDCYEQYHYDACYSEDQSQTGCRKCGCSAEKDSDGERICFCDTCCKDGCDIIQ